MVPQNMFVELKRSFALNAVAFQRGIKKSLFIAIVRSTDVRASGIPLYKLMPET